VLIAAVLAWTQLDLNRVGQAPQRSWFERVHPVEWAVVILGGLYWAGSVIAVVSGAKRLLM
jgi:hypothetical protein